MTQRIGWLTMTILASAMVGTAQDGAKLAYGETVMYRQTLAVEADGPLPEPSIAPVYDGHRWGLSTRWDDNHPNASNVRRKMLENGIRGSFYLTSRQPEQAEGSLARFLSQEGKCSVGGHSVSHPKLPEVTANKTFFELMDNRIALECLTDQPVNSLAFPYGQYQAKDRPEVLQAVSEAFLRTGYHHCVYSGFVMHNPHLPAGVVTTGLQVVPGDKEIDAGKFWASVEKIRANEANSRKTSDCIFLGVHPWQVGPVLEELGEVMAKMHDLDDFWHCTQTEWAAYAKQRHDTKVTPVAPGTYVLERPAAFDLGNDIGLTLVFASTAVRAATVDGVVCELRQADGKTYVNVPHAAAFGLPAKIDRTGADGSTAEFPGIKASLTLDPAGKIVYALENGTGEALTSGVLTISLPPACEPGLLRWSQPEIAAGGKWSATATAQTVREGDYWQEGKPYVAAQFDFILGGERGRLFATGFGTAP
jgi:peptidoglycan/xylan/chitin deacetylase (PgdA/CDA1 family)